MSKHKKFRGTFTFDGKRYEVEADTERELGEKLGAKKVALEHGYVSITSSMKVKVWGEEYLKKYKEPFVSDGQFSSLTGHMKIIINHMGNMKLKDVKKYHCQQLISSMSGMSRGYINKVKCLLSSMFAEAIEEDLIYKNPAIRLKLPVDVKRKEIRMPLRDFEREVLLKVGERLGDPYDAYIKLMLYFGLRPSEACRVKYCHFTLDGKQRKLHVIGTKTVNSTRDVLVPEHLVEWIEKYRNKPFDLFIKNRDNGPANKQARLRMWGAIRRDAHLMLGGRFYRNKMVAPYPLDQRVTAYCLRHTYASDMIAKGIPKDIVSILMGHADISTTDIYINITDEMFAIVSDKINSMEQFAG